MLLMHILIRLVTKALKKTPAHSTSFSDEPTSDILNLKARDKSREAAIQFVQVEQTIRNLPLFIVFHAAAAFSLYTIATYPDASILLPIWYSTAFLAGIYGVVAFLLWRKASLQKRPQAMLRGLELLCLILAIVWALPLAAAAQVQSPTNTIAVACITLAMLGVTATTLIRVPTGLVVFLCLVSSTMGLALFRSLAEQQSVAMLLCVTYCLVLLSITLSSHMDFRRRTHAELEVVRQKDVIRLLLNDFERGTPDWLWEADIEGKINYASPRLSTLLGIAPDDVLGKRLRHVLASYVQHETLRNFDLSLDAAEPINNLEIVATINDETFHWRMTAQPLLDESGGIMGHRGVCRDVTSTLKDKKRVETAMDESDRASAVKSHFLAAMSHELRTPINAILGFSELLAKDNHDAIPYTTRKAYAETVWENSKQLNQLINDVLDTTRMERGTLKLAEQNVDAAELIEVAIGLCRSKANDAGVSIVARLADDVSLTVDAARLQQATANIVNNAIKFSSRGGIINIEMLRGPNNSFILAVKDAGIGIAEADLQKIFEPFVQSDSGLARHYNGAGLGLPLARRIARLHEGDVTLQSTQGAGTTAHLTLPKHRVHWPMQKPQPQRSVA
jgi:PAS domain S-box-containing protein